MWTTIQTKLGKIQIKGTGDNHFYCTTHPGSGINADDSSPLVLRGKQHHVSCHIYLGVERTPHEMWNDIYFAGGNGPTSFQRETIHREINDAVQKYCAEHPELVIQAERRYAQRQVETLEQKLFDLEREAQEVRNQLEVAKAPLRDWQASLPNPVSAEEDPMDWLWCQEHLGP